MRTYRLLATDLWEHIQYAPTLFKTWEENGDRLLQFQNDTDAFIRYWLVSEMIEIVK